MADDLAAFGEKLAELERTEVNLAVGLLWYFDHAGEAEVSASKLATTIHDLSIRNKVNASRLATKLKAHRDVVNGSKRGTFRLKLSQKPALTERYLPLLKRPKPKVDDHVIPSEDFEGTRPYLEKIVEQINGCYQFRFYDGCMVMCRRLTESLLISAFEEAGQTAAIKKGSDYVMLSELISIAKSGKHIKLPRGLGAILDEIKGAGDAAAHSRTYITKQPDVDDLKLRLRRAVTELMQLANVEAKKV